MPSPSKRPRNATRTGVFGIALVVCLVLVSFGYTKLPFWPHGKRYDAYFTNAAGVMVGNDVDIAGIVVGQVTADRIASLFVLESLGERSFKNVSQPLAVYRIIPPGVYSKVT